MFLVLVCSALTAYATWSLVCLEVNYRRASKMGIPLVRLPIDPLNILFQVLEPHIWRVLDALPLKLPLPTSSRYGRRGWFFGDKAQSHLRYGPIWALVTPRDIHVQVCDSEANHEIFARRHDFVRPSKMYTLLEVYGPCISTADSANWPRHRKILAAPFNESVMSFVWTESLQKTHQMIEYWTTSSHDSIPSVAKDARSLSLNVLAATGFRRSLPFRGSSVAALDTEGGLLSYRDALQIVLDNAILLMLFPYWLLEKSWMPKAMRRIGKAAEDFKAHMVRMFEEEVTAKVRGEKGTGSLMTSFVRALDVHAKDDTTATKGPRGLSVDEIYGNIFVINFAGHDTTANTLAFSFLLLAAYPEVQQWIAEEVSTVTKDLQDIDWAYNELFPKLKRCEAILLETLRLFPPIMSLPKWTNAQPQELVLGDRTIVIPPLTGISLSILATHTHPHYWPDPLAWKPSRWITVDNTSGSPQETLVTPARNTFMPWSDGPQNCLGAKFSQVEFVAVIACLFRAHRLSVQQLPEEDAAQATARVLRVVEDCDAQLLLRMKNPDRIRLKCEKA
ncbi:cytochrome P450 [Melanomma pulvis-pyrius CBS 109.77]|uniref:Cytochrome P450 n=1 Tax=Melanomma pulvis-pyrius CBS 109.77 TaxID=1314802 RepID=A0A6A6X0S7_9PLEO|nr:cytochrome P450 [Melanomma pulvis-pyrius CBS 109.77]